MFAAASLSLPRLLLALCALLLSAGFGSLAARELEGRSRLIKSLYRDISAMRGWIAYRAWPVEELLRRLRDTDIGPLWSGIAQRISGRPLALAWQEGLCAFESSLLAPLTREDRAILSELGEALGSAGMEGQLLNMELTLKRLEAAEEQARNNAETRGKLYRSLGTLLGMAAAIVIV